MTVEKKKQREERMFVYTCRKFSNISYMYICTCPLATIHLHVQECSAASLSTVALEVYVHLSPV